MRLLPSIAILATAAASANAAVLYEIVSGDTTSTSSVQNQNLDVASASGYTKGAGLGFTSSGATFNVTTFNTANTSAAAAVADGEVITWSFALSTAYNLDSFSIRYDKSNTGPDDLEIALDTGSGFVTVLTDTAISAAGEEALDVDLSAFDNVTAGTFRIALFNAGGSTGTFDLENSVNISTPSSSFSLEGTAVPEPATLGLLGLAGLAMGRRRR